MRISVASKLPRKASGMERGRGRLRRKRFRGIASLRGVRHSRRNTALDMDALSAGPIGADDWAARFAAALGAQRERIRNFLAAQQSRLQRTEARLRDQSRALRELLQREAQQVEQAQQTLEQRRAELDRREAELERLASQLTVQREQWDELCRQTISQSAVLGEQWRRQQAEWFAQLAEQQAAIDDHWRCRQAAFEEHCRTELEHLEQLRHRQQAELDALRSELDRRSAELERRRAELEQRETGLERRLALGEVAADLVEPARLSSAHDSADGPPPGEPHEADRTPVGRSAAAADAAIDTSGRETSSTDVAEAEAYRRRYEMALEDLKQLRARCAELEEQLANRTSAGGGALGGPVLNWELEKRKILAALEAESAEGPGENERLEIHRVVAKTDQILAEKDRMLAEKDRLLADKDREIEELKILLENQSGNLGSVAVGAAALGELFDQDAVIQEHRRHLEQLQAELQEKMRQAEIEISLERAKLARERAKLEEQLRALPRSDEHKEEPKSEPSLRGRWRAQLGIAGEKQNG